MSTTTKQLQSNGSQATEVTEEQQQALDARQTLVDEYSKTLKRFEEAKGRNDKKTQQSCTGSLSVVSHKIREAEVEIELTGADYTPWEKPRNAAKSRLAPLTQAQIESSLKTIGQVFKTSKFETTKNSCDKRITALMKAAEKRGYTVKDPRK